MRKKARKTHRKLMQMIALTVSVMMVFVSADGTKLFADSMQKFNDTLKDETNELKVSAQASLKTVSKGSAFKAERIEKDTALYKGIESKTDDLAKGSSHRSLLAYSFTFSKNGKSYQPYGNIDVAMNWKNAISPSSYKDAQDITVYNFSLKNNKVTDVEKLSDQPYTKTEVNNEHKLKSLSFKSDQLSYVVITWTNKPVTYDHSLSYKGKDYNISLKYGDSTKINSTDRLEVKELGKDHKDYDRYSDAAAKKVINNKADADDLDVARLFDIKIIDTAGKEKEPDASVQVNFTFNKKQNNLSDYQIVHFKNNSVKNIQVLDPQSHKDNKSLSFKTDSFSLYEIVNVIDDSTNIGDDVTAAFKKEMDENAEYEIINVSDYLKNPNTAVSDAKGLAIQCDGNTALNSKTLTNDNQKKEVSLFNSDPVVAAETRWKVKPIGTDDILIYTSINGSSECLNISGDRHNFIFNTSPGSGLKIKAGPKLSNGLESLIIYKQNARTYISANIDNEGKANGFTTVDNATTDSNNHLNIDDNSAKNAAFIFRKIDSNDNDAKQGSAIDVDSARFDVNKANDSSTGTDITNDFMSKIDTSKKYAIVNVSSVLENAKRTQGVSLQYNKDKQVSKEVMTVLPSKTDGFVYKSNYDANGNPFNMQNQNSATDGITQWQFETRGSNNNRINIYTTENNTKQYLDIDNNGNVITSSAEPNAGFTIRKGRSSSGLNSFIIYKEDVSENKKTADIKNTNKHIQLNFGDGGSNTGVILDFKANDGLPNADNLNNSGFILCSKPNNQLEDAHIGIKEGVSDITKSLQSAGESTADGSMTTNGNSKKVIVYTRDDDGNYYALAYGNRDDPTETDPNHQSQWRYLKKLYNNGTSIGYRGNEDAIWTLKKEEYDDHTVYNLYDQGQTGKVKSFDREQDKQYIYNSSISNDEEIDRKKKGPDDPKFYSDEENRFYPLVMNGAYDKNGTYNTTIVRADYAKRNNLHKENYAELYEDIERRYPKSWNGSNWSDTIDNETKFAQKNPLIAGALENTFIYGETTPGYKTKQDAIDEKVDDIDQLYAGYKGYSTFSGGSSSKSIGYNWYFAVIDTDANGEEKPDINNGGKINKVSTVDSISKGIKINMFDYDGNSDSKAYYWNKDKDAKYNSTDPDQSTGPIQGQMLGRAFIDSKNSGQDIVQGIVQNKLKNGYPVVTENGNFEGHDDVAKGQSLDKLFDPAVSAAAKTTTTRTQVYQNCNHLFSQSIYDETGYFEYSSFNNFAHLNGSASDSTHDFTVYDQIASPYAYYKRQDDSTEFKDYTGNDFLDTSVLNSKYLERGNFLPFNDIAHSDNKVQLTTNYDVLSRTDQQQPNTLGEVELATNNQLTDTNLQNMNKKDPNFGRTMYRVLHPDYRFGMTMEANFYQPIGVDKDGKPTNPGEDPEQDNRPITFEFNGDDDMWVFIDDVLVLDMGGVHDAHEGRINFKTGDVTIDTYGKNVNTPVKWTKNLKQIFQQAEGNNFKSDEFTNDATDSNKGTFKANTTHTLKMFYMERGEGASNLVLRTNIKTSTLGVTKKVVDQEGKDMSQSSIPDVIKNRINHTEFYFRIKEGENYVNIDSLYAKGADRSKQPYYQDKDGHNIQISGENVPLQTAKGSGGTVFVLYNGYTANFPGIDSNIKNIKVEEVPYYNQSKASDNSDFFSVDSDNNIVTKATNSPVTELYKMFDSAKGELLRGDRAKYHTGSSTEPVSETQSQGEQDTNYWVKLDEKITTSDLSVSDSDRNEGDRFEFTNKLRSYTANVKKISSIKDKENKDIPVADAEYTLYPINSVPIAYASNSKNTKLNRLYGNVPNYPEVGGLINSGVRNTKVSSSVDLNQFNIIENNIFRKNTTINFAYKDVKANAKTTVTVQNRGSLSPLVIDEPLYSLGEIKSYSDFDNTDFKESYINSSAILNKNNRWVSVGPIGGITYRTIANEKNNNKGYFYKVMNDSSVSSTPGLDLIPGVTYILKETKGAPGYNTSDEVWAIQVETEEENGSVSYTTHMRCIKNSKQSVTDENGVKVVKDEPGTSLPVTGQRGIVLSLLIAGAFIAYSSYRIVKKRRDDDAEE